MDTKAEIIIKRPNILSDIIEEDIFDDDLSTVSVFLAGPTTNNANICRDNVILYLHDALKDIECRVVLYNPIIIDNNTTTDQINNRIKWEYNKLLKSDICYVIIPENTDNKPNYGKITRTEIGIAATALSSTIMDCYAEFEGLDYYQAICDYNTRFNLYINDSDKALEHLKYDIISLVSYKKKMKGKNNEK